MFITGESLCEIDLQSVWGLSWFLWHEPTRGSANAPRYNTSSLQLRGFPDKVIFQSMSEGIWDYFGFAFLCSVIGLEHLHHKIRGLFLKSLSNITGPKAYMCFKIRI